MVGLERIHQDMMFLAGRLMHRGAQTDEERRAADFIRDRLREHMPDAHLDDFHTIDNHLYLFASYLTEFLLVAVLAIWWPIVAACYGFGVLCVYLAEFMGISIFSRLLPQFDSQNVVGRLLSEQPERIFIITAHYDSGAATPLSHPRIVPWLRPLHTLIVACMVLIIGTCVTEGLGTIPASAQAVLNQLRWGGVIFLLTNAFALFLCSARAEDIRGANRNASGVAAMLQLAQRFSEQPLERTDLWFVATGSHEAWMGGMRHFLSTERIERPYTWMLNIEGVGSGTLSYLTAEGMLQRLPADKHMVKAAGAAAGQHGAEARTMRAVPTQAHVPLARGVKTLTVMGLDEEGLPPHWNWFTDLVTEVDERAIARAAGFSEALLRRLDADLDQSTGSMG